MCCCGFDDDIPRRPPLKYVTLLRLETCTDDPGPDGSIDERGCLQGRRDHYAATGWKGSLCESARSGTDSIVRWNTTVTHFVPGQLMNTGTGEHAQQAARRWETRSVPLACERSDTDLAVLTAREKRSLMKKGQVWVCPSQAGCASAGCDHGLSERDHDVST